MYNLIYIFFVFPSVFIDVEHEVKCLRKWVKEMESRLQPLNFHIEWTLPELEKKALEHMVSFLLSFSYVYFLFLSRFLSTYIFIS